MDNEAAFIFFRNMTMFIATIMLIKLFVFLSFSAIYPVVQKIRYYHNLRRQQKRKKSYAPLVSVIVPARNEEVGIMRTIKSVVDSDYHNLELIVVNDGSTDRSRKLVDKFIASRRKRSATKCKIVQYYIKNGGKGKALNYGIKKSSGEIILTIDADSALAPNAISNLIKHFQDPNISSVVGQVRIANIKGRIIGVMQYLEYMFGFFYKRAHCVMGAEYIFGGACAAFRRKSTFDRFGLFDEDSKTEDIEMSMRVKFFGLKSIYAEDVICYTEGATSYFSLINQRLRWKKGRFDAFIRYREMFFSLNKKHNKWLCWFILPFALLSEIQLLLEPIGVTLLITYSFIANEYVSLFFSMLFVGIPYFVVAIFGKHMSFWRRIGLVLLWPITWPLFYIVVWVEFHAILRGLSMIIRGDNLEWQKWNREGIA